MKLNENIASKLKDSITSNSIKIIDLYNKIDSGVWDTSPDFQRKLVWKKQHKYAFINTILLNYPFPEIYIASEQMDIEAIKSQEFVVDGKQRVTTIVDYIKGIGDFLETTKVKAFAELEIDEKRDFLNYSVTVKDLKDLGMELITDIFLRINSTDYSLNKNERLNASYGDGEFSMFCKQIVNPDFNPTNADTDVVIPKELKEKLNNFFTNNNIFTDNDKNRMFDTQFMLLLVSTILEGAYFGRSSTINSYLKKYNAEFEAGNTVLAKIVNAVQIVESLELSSNSYWFNKANLFTLLIELSKFDPININLELLEMGLLELENKVDIYFTDDDIGMISEEERKYFEYARQGSNELASREHRGKILKGMINNSLKIVASKEDKLSKINLEYFRKKEIDFATFKPTETGLKKGIIDATLNVREFLKSKTLHDYYKQELGPDKKVFKQGKFILQNNESKDTTITFYRSNGRGDYRMWFNDLTTFAKANDQLALLEIDGQLNVLNLTKYNYTELY